MVELKEGDIFLLKEGYKVYTSRGEIEIGKKINDFDTSILAGQYVVTKTEFSGCGQGHDVFPDGHKVFAKRILNNKTVTNFEVSFYQSGCFTCMIKNPTITGHATCKWVVK
jgi:hypothetical protein